jgi:hypothetical protein
MRLLAPPRRTRGASTIAHGAAGSASRCRCPRRRCRHGLTLEPSHAPSQRSRWHRGASMPAPRARATSPGDAMPSLGAIMPAARARPVAPGCRRGCTQEQSLAPQVTSHRHLGRVRRHPGAGMPAPRDGASAPGSRHAGTSGWSDCTWVQACRHLGMERLHLGAGMPAPRDGAIAPGEAMPAPRDGALSPWCRSGSTSGSHPSSGCSRGA